jgi:hypothetical protein
MTHAHAHLLLDSETNTVIGAATREQIQASRGTVEGHIMIDPETGEVVPTSQRDLHVRCRGDSLRRVYVARRG